MTDHLDCMRCHQPLTVAEQRMGSFNCDKCRREIVEQEHAGANARAIERANRKVRA